MKKKTAFIALLSAFALSSGAGAIMVSGCTVTNGRIDAPTELEADLGTYVVPDYDVVDDSGMILAGYNVYLKSVKDADGEELAESYGSAVTVDEAGVYSFVYSAGTNKVADVTVSIDFADRTAPTINCDDSTIPKFFITGNSYKVPAYTLSGDFVRDKCWAKVFYIDGSNAETEVQITSGRFKVDKTSGTYEIRIHVEDAVGNANDYKYSRKVDGPETIVEHKILYLDEEFGERQVSCYQSEYTGGFVARGEEGAHAYEDESGAYKVSFNGETPTQYNEGLVVMDVPAIIDINEYEDLYMYVYNDSGSDIIMGSQWWNDTKVKAGEWTKLTWNTRAWGNNRSANNTKPIGIVDITGMTIRFIFDYDHNIIPHGDFYLSAMYGTPKIKTELELGENVSLSGTKYYVNDVVELGAAPIDGKTVDYFKVDGEIIPGTNFTVTDTKHKIEVVYRDGELTKDNMTWVCPESFTVTGDDNQWQTFGVSNYFAYTFDIYGAAEGWCYAAAQVGGNGQLLGFEISDETHSKFSGYGGAWKWGDGVLLSKAQYDAIRGATEENPVKAALVRRGTEIRAYLIYGGKADFIASVDNSTLGITVNEYGYGKRNGPTNISHNVALVGSETKTLLYFETFAATVTAADDKVTFDGEKFYLGDTVTLKGAAAPAGQMLAYFTVNGERISGSEFTVLKAQTTVAAVYTPSSVLTLADGIKTSDGKTGTVQVARDSFVTLEYVGNAPVGKVCVGFIVDGAEVRETTIHVSGEAHTIEVLFEDTVNEKLNDISGAKADGTGLKFDGLGDDGANKWAPASVEYVTDFSYSGPDGTIDRNSLLKLKTQAGENSFALTNGEDDLDAYEEIYFYVYTTASGVKAGGWWCNDTIIEPATWTRVGFKREADPKNNPTDIINNGTKSVWEGGLKNFAIRIFNAPADATVYVTAVYGVPFGDVTVTKDAATSEHLGLSAPKYGANYRENETVTLTCSGAPANKAFVCFTVNGEPIDGATYKLTASGAEFGIKFEDASTVTFKGGAAEANGETVFGKGAKITLTHEVKEGKIFDYYLIDNARQLHTDTFVTSESAHTVEAVYADGVDGLTWANGGSEYDYETVMGSAASGWKSWGCDGEVYGQAEYWAVSVNVKYTEEWNSFEFIQGTSKSLRIRFHKDGYLGIMVHDNGAEDYPSKEFTAAWPTKNEELVNKLKAGVTITCVRNGGEITLYANGVKFFTTNYAFSNGADWFGIAYVNGDGATKPTMKDTKFITGQAKVEAYLEKLQTLSEATGETQINNVFGAVAKDGSAVEYVGAGVPAGLNDENVKETGALKITAASDGIGLSAGLTFDGDASKYSEIYFWVYVESEQEEDLKRVAGGAYWKDGGKIAKTNTWTKISFNEALIAELADGANTDLSKFTFRVYSQDWNVETEGEYTSLNGKTIYLTSLYGVPKA